MTVSSLTSQTSFPTDGASLATTQDDLGQRIARLRQRLAAGIKNGSLSADAAKSIVAQLDPLTKTYQSEVSKGRLSPDQIKDLAQQVDAQAKLITQLSGASSTASSKGTATAPAWNEPVAKSETEIAGRIQKLRQRLVDGITSGNLAASDAKSIAKSVADITDIFKKDQSSGALDTQHLSDLTALVNKANTVISLGVASKQNAQNGQNAQTSQTGSASGFGALTSAGGQISLVNFLA